MGRDGQSLMTHMVLMAPYMIGNYFCCLNILQKLLLIMEFYGFFKQMRVLKPKALQNKRWWLRSENYSKSVSISNVYKITESVMDVYFIIFNVMYINSMQSSSFELICKDYRTVSFRSVSSLEYTCIIFTMNQLVSSKNASR